MLACVRPMKSVLHEIYHDLFKKMYTCLAHENFFIYYLFIYLLRKRAYVKRSKLTAKLKLKLWELCGKDAMQALGVTGIPTISKLDLKSLYRGQHIVDSKTQSGQPFSGYLL